MSETQAAPQAVFRSPVVNKQILYRQGSGYYPPTADYEAYTDALQTDETVSACVAFIVDTAIAKIGDYIHPEEPVQEYVREQLEGIEGSILDAFKAIFLGTFYGFSVLEIVTTEEGDLQSLIPIDPATAVFHLSEEPGPDFGKIDRVIQYPLQAIEARLPVDKCVIFVNRGAAFNPYGYGRLEAVLPLARQKKKLYETMERTFDRYGAPVTVAYIDNPADIIPKAGGGTETRLEAMQAQIKQTENLAGWTCGKDDKLEFIFPPDVGKSFAEQLQLFNRLIMRGLMTPSLLLDAGDVGSYSLGQTQLDLYLQYVDSLIDSAADCLIDQLIRPMIVYAFGDDFSDFGRFATKPTNADLQAYSQLILPLIQAGVLDLTGGDLKKIRDRLGLEVS